MNTITRLRSMHFSATEQRIADFVLRNADHLSSYTISTIAEECRTSKSMVVQLCKSAGFKGYKELCSQLLVERALGALPDQPDETCDDILPGYTPEQIAQVIVRQEMAALQDTLDLINPAELKKAVHLIRDADRVLLCGVGESGLAARDLDTKFSLIGIISRYTSDVHCQVLETSSLTENSVCMVFSFSGRTRDMIEAAELAHEMGAKVITITCMGDNPVGALADVRLNVAISEGPRRAAAMSSRMSTMCLVDVLYSCLLSESPPDATRRLERNLELANRRRRSR